MGKPNMLPAYAFKEKELYEAVIKTIAICEYFSEREIKILKLRLGLTGEEPKTLQATGDVMGVNRERIRQIEAKTLEKIRQMILKYPIDDFYEEITDREVHSMIQVALNRNLNRNLNRI